MSSQVTTTVTATTVPTIPNRIMRVPVSHTASPEFRAKQRMMKALHEEGWGYAEIGLMFGLAKSWVGMIVRDVTFFFYCGACGAQVATKKAECRQCDEADIAEALARMAREPRSMAAEDNDSDDEA